MKSLKLPLKAATETALGELGRAVEPLFHVEESDVCRDARSLYRRLLPEVTKSQRLLSAVPRLVLSLLSSLERLAPKHGVHRQTIAAIWVEVERTSESQATTARSQPG
jgi:hypothetical protein